MKSLLLRDFPLRDLEIQGGGSLATRRTGIGTHAPELKAEASMELEVWNKQVPVLPPLRAMWYLVYLFLSLLMKDFISGFLLSPCGKVTQSQFWILSKLLQHQAGNSGVGADLILQVHLLCLFLPLCSIIGFCSIWVIHIVPQWNDTTLCFYAFIIKHYSWKKSPGLPRFICSIYFSPNFILNKTPTVNVIYVNESNKNCYRRLPWHHSVPFCRALLCKTLWQRACHRIILFLKSQSQRDKTIIYFRML